MKLNKTMGRVATTLVATAMLASVAVVPTFADEIEYGTTGTPSTALSQITLHKELDMPTNVVTSADATFKFTMTGVAPSSTTETIISHGQTYDVKTGTGTVESNNVVFTKGSEDGDQKDVTFALSGLSFTEPGVYKYQITETTTPAGFTNETGTLDAYLFVEDTNGSTDGGIQIYGVVVTTPSENANKEEAETKTDTVVNSYMMDATGSLTVTKNIDGTMASPNDEFTFTVSGLTADNTYVVSGTDITDENNQIVADDEGKYQFTLKANETLTIMGLTAKEYVVTETPSDKGYSLTSVTGKDADDKVISDGAADVTLTTEQMTKTVTFLNTRNAVSPTGIVMNVAPYALLVVVAAAGCFVFMRKRRED